MAFVPSSSAPRRCNNVWDGHDEVEAIDHRTTGYAAKRCIGRCIRGCIAVANRVSGPDAPPAKEPLNGQIPYVSRGFELVGHQGLEP